MDMARRTGSRVFAALLALGLTASCVAGSRHDRDGADCAYVQRHCATYCDTYCDDYGCWPVCWDACWDECGAYSRKPVGIADGSAPPATDGSVQDASKSDAAPDDGGTAPTLCTACQKNEDCAAGGLCVRAGGTSGASFCSQACTTTCPAGYTCAPLGSTKQCLPASGACRASNDDDDGGDASAATDAASE